MKYKPFISFYNKYNIIPVKQNIKKPDFYYNRSYLYTRLGVPLSNFESKSVIEFGSGGGFNASAIIRHKPSSYTFVDDSLRSLELIKKSIKYKKKKIIKSDIFNYKKKKKYDFVIIEGVLSGQIHPEKMLKHVSEFVNENGVLIITVSSTCGLLSEICRRLMVIKIDEISRERERGARYNLNRRLSLACKIFSPHLKTLNANSRSVKDWCLDSIFNPWLGDYNFTISKAINAIGKDFNIYHTASPSFFLDDSWYKKSQKKDINKLAVNQFYQKLLGFLDSRFNFDSIGGGGGLIKILEN